MKNKKIIQKILLSLIIITIIYFVSGIAAFGLFSSISFNKRSDEYEKNLVCPDIQYTYQDFTSLQNRELISFKNTHDELLQGYYYEIENPKGTIIFTHGYNSYADSNFVALQNYFLNKSYNIFSFDLTGHGLSQGKGIYNLYEPKYCIEKAIDTIKDYKTSKDKPIYLLGYSIGAYGSLLTTKDVKAVASFAGFESPSNLVYYSACNNVSKLLAITKPSLYLSMYLLKGKEMFYKASEVIKENKNINYLLIQGDKDKTVDINHSVYNEFKDNDYDNVKTVKLEEYGHTYLWYEKESIDYINEKKDIINQLNKLKNDYKNQESINKYNQLLLEIDKEKTSKLNLDLLERIEQLFS